MVLLIISSADPVFSCTNFSYATQSGAVVHAQNYDWDVANGVLVYNPAGIEKKGLEKNPPVWTSQFPSLTFNQYGLEFPVGGMNSQGLAIGVMWLTETAYPEADPEKPSIEPLQWLQYQLDNAATVAEAVERAKKLTVRPIFGAQVAIHFLLSDSTGDSAIVEFLNGEQLIYHGDTLITSVLTNTPYNRCVNSLSDYASFGGSLPDPTGYGSRDRFIQMSIAAKNAISLPDSTAAQATTYAHLDEVKDPTRTVWSIVYDLTGKSLSFKTLSFPALRTVSFADFEEITCADRALAIDLNEPLAGEVRDHFQPYTQQWNQQIAVKSFSATPVTMLISSDLVKGLATFPYGFDCQISTSALPVEPELSQ